MISALRDALLAKLGTMTNIVTYDGLVPDEIPADQAGHVFPYVVLWPEAGAPAQDRSLAGLAGYRWQPTLTIVAGQPGWAVSAVQAVRELLEGWHIAPGRALVEADGWAGPILQDPDANPVRWFRPIPFQTYT